MTEFTNGLFGCFEDMPLCAMTYCCPCFVAGKIAEGVGENCILHGCLALTNFNIWSAAMMRTKVREKYGIEGSCFKDCCIHCCCPCCAYVQNARELKAHDNLLAGPGMGVIERQ